MTGHRRVAAALTALSPRSRRLILVLIAGLVIAAVYPLWTATPTVVHNPYLQNMREDRVTLVWAGRSRSEG